MKKSLLTALLVLLATIMQAQSPLPITDTPQGRTQLMSRLSMTVYVTGGTTIKWTQSDNFALEAVYADNGDVYLKNYLGHLYDPDRPVWIKGHIYGDTLTIQLPQVAYVQYNEDGSETLGELYALTNNLVLATPSLPRLADNQEAKFIVHEDGTLEQATMDILGLYIPGDETDRTSGFQGYGEYAVVLTPVPFTQTQAPEDAQWEEWSMTHDNGGQRVSVALQGDAIYVRGLYGDIPDGVVKGTISQGKAVFESPQYLGYPQWGRTFAHMFGATRKGKYNERQRMTYYQYIITQEPLSLDWDAEGQSLTAADNRAAVISSTAPIPSKTLTEAYGGMRIFKQEDYGAPARPCNPIVHIFEAFDPSQWAFAGMGGFMFQTPWKDVNGGLLDPEQLYYSVYIDDEDGKLWCDPSDYRTVGLIAPEGTDEIPATFTDGDAGDFSLPEPILHQFYLYVYGIERIGVQQIYKGGGETRVSDIVWWESDGSITTQAMDDPVGLQQTQCDTGSDSAPRFYDLTGRRVAHPAHGVFVKEQGGEYTKVRF